MAKGHRANMWQGQPWTNHEAAAKAIATVCAPLRRKISDLAAPQMFASSFVRDICTPITKTSASLLRRFLQIPSVQWIGWDKLENPPWNLVLEPELLGREAVSQTPDLKSNCRCRLFVFPLVQTISCMSYFYLAESWTTDPLPAWTSMLPTAWMQRVCVVYILCCTAHRSQVCSAACLQSSTLGQSPASRYRPSLESAGWTHCRRRCMAGTTALHTSWSSHPRQAICPQTCRTASVHLG